MRGILSVVDIVWVLMLFGVFVACEEVRKGLLTKKEDRFSRIETK